MFEFIPAEIYSNFYYHSLFLLCLFTYLHTIVLNPTDSKVIIFNRTAAFIVLTLIILYIGLRPISGVFVDMTTYARTFERFKINGFGSVNGDYGFSYFMILCTKIMSVEGFFFTSCLIYVLPLYKASKIWFPKFYFFSFLLFVASFSFWIYGVNGIRNGMATSIFILAIALIHKRFYLGILFMFLSYTFHSSMALPCLAFIITYYIKDSKKYYFFWLLSILLSLAMGGIWENIFASLGFGDERLSAYLTTDASSSKFSSTGFRFDFLLYSAAPLAVAFYFKFKKGFNDLNYDRILHTYMICNAFWIMIIRANFSNRFAYLSWFLMAVVVVYPFIKYESLDNQFKKLGLATVLYYGFTYMMFFIYQSR